MSETEMRKEGVILHWQRKELILLGIAAAVTLTGCAQNEQGNPSEQTQEAGMEEKQEVQVSEESGKEAVDATVVIDPANASTFHAGKFEGWGTSFCWWANRIGYSDTLTQQAAQAFYDKEQGLGLNIIRYNVGGGDDPEHDHITRTDSDMPGYAINPSYDEATGEYTWEYDWSADANQRNVLLQALKVCGEDAVVEGFSNSAPYFMTNSGCSSGAQLSNKNNLKDDAYDAFAQYIADVTEYYKDTYNVDFSSYSAMNEPYTDYWGAYSWKQEGCHFDMGESQSQMLLSLRNALDAKGLDQVQVSGTDETSIDVQILSYGQLSQEAKDVVDRIDTHTYGGSRREALRTLAETEGKNLWMSEVDGGDTAGENAGEMGAGLWLAQRVITDMNELRPSAWVMWQAIDNHICAEGYQGRTDSGMPDISGGYWGLAVADHDEQQLILTMKYYALGQFTRYIRPGYTIISGDEHSLAAYDAEGHRLIVVMTNVTGKDRKVDVDLSAFSQTGSNVSVIRTSGDMSSGEKWQELSPIETYGAGFYAELIPNSVTTYIVQDVY